MQIEINYSGDLDLAARALERVYPVLTELWNEGRYRMRKQEIVNASEYLARVRKASTDIKSVLKLFEEIAAVPHAEVKIETVEEKLGLIPARLIEEALA